MTLQGLWTLHLGILWSQRLRFAVSETVKMHILMVHVEQFIEMTGKPLGEFSEQSLEDSHSLFQEYWKKFLIKDIDSEKYLANNEKCILTLNASNVQVLKVIKVVFRMLEQRQNLVIQSQQF